MKDNFNLLVEAVDKCLSTSNQTSSLALIEKEILLEKIRQLYITVSIIETIEHSIVHNTFPNKEAKVENSVKEEISDLDVTTLSYSGASLPKEDSPGAESSAAEISEEKVNNDPIEKVTQSKNVEEDVELFFDTEHESYDATDISNELDAISIEIESNAENVTIKESHKPEIIAEDDDSDIFDNLEIETHIEVKDDEIKDNADTLLSEEDDILNFIPKKEEKNKTQQAPQRSLNDLFNQKREDNSISSQYQHAKVGDLTKAISINDKFIYIKELFHNRGEDFSESVKMLNDCKNLNEAFDCLEQLKNKYYWDSSSDAYLSFCDLLRRKYS